MALKKKKDLMVVVVHIMSPLLSSPQPADTDGVTKWVFHPSLSPPCHNHCSLWSLCPLCPFKMQHVMRALEDCVSGLFSYSDKSSSHIPRSLSQLLTDTSQLSSVIVCPIYKVIDYTDLPQTLTVNPCVLTVDLAHVGHSCNVPPHGVNYL